MKKYIVLNRFRDRENNLSTYKKGEEYPKQGAPSFSNERINELIAKGFIEEEKIVEPKKEGKDNVKKI